MPTDEELRENPDYFRGKPDEFLAYAKKTWKFNPSFCARHWMPCPVEGKPGMLVSVILMTESFGLMPDDLFKPGQDATTAMNSWMQNQTTPLCCKFGDEKMEWLWWIVCQDSNLCMEKTPVQGKSIRVCWRWKGHAGIHEWAKPMPRSVFDLMDEVHP